MDVTASKTLLQRVLAMQITEKELIQIINEEVQDMLDSGEIDENILDRLKAQGAGALASLNPLGDKGDAAVRKAASLMKSYDTHLLRLAQKMQVDAQKLGIEDSKELQDVRTAMKSARAQIRQMAIAAPRSMRDKARDARRDAAAAAGRGQQQQQAAPAQQQAAPAQQQQQAAPAQPAAAPAATPPSTSSPETGQKHYLRNTDNFEADKAAQDQAAAARRAKKAATPASAPAATPAAKPKRQLSQDPRNVRRREKRAAAKAAAEKERARKDKRNAQARARRAAAKRPAAAANSAVNESRVKKDETLNEQLQEISKRWGFGK